MERLGAVPYFRKLSRDQLEHLAGASSIEEVPRFHVIIHEGSSASRRFYSVISGSLEVTDSHGAQQMVLAEGDTFGESALIAPGKARRNANVVALEASVLLVVDASRIIADGAGALHFDVPLVIARLKTHVLNVLPLFRHVDDAAMEALADATRSSVFSPRQAVITRGSTVRAFYVVMAGTLDLVNEQGHLVRTVTPRSMHAHVGELGLFLRRPCLVSAVARSELHLLVVPAKPFRVTMLQYSRAKEQVLRNALSNPRLALFLRANVAEVQGAFDLRPGDRILYHLRVQADLAKGAAQGDPRTAQQRALGAAFGIDLPAPAGADDRMLRAREEAEEAAAGAWASARSSRRGSLVGETGIRAVARRKSSSDKPRQRLHPIGLGDVVARALEDSRAQDFHDAVFERATSDERHGPTLMDTLKQTKSLAAGFDTTSFDPTY